MRKIGANYIFTSCSPILKQGYLTVDDSGCIIDIMDTKGQLPEISGLEYYSGILIPGLIIGTKNTKKAIQLTKNFVDKNKEYRILWKKGIQCIATNEDMNELKTINPINLLKDSPKSSNEAIRINTITKAKLLGVENLVGSFSIGKKPGILLISGYNFKTDQLNTDALITRII